MSTQYCEVCGQHVECTRTGVRCGMDSSDDMSYDDDLGYLNDCPFDNELTILELEDDFDEEDLDD